MTRASSVDRGRWKFVTIASTRRNSKPGVMNNSVRPSSGAPRASVSQAPTSLPEMLEQLDRAVPPARAQAARRPRQPLPHVAFDPLQQEHLAARLLDRDPRRNHPRVVDDHELTARELLRQLREPPVRD